MDEPKAFISENHKWRPSKRSQLVVFTVIAVIIIGGGLWYSIMRLNQNKQFNTAMSQVKSDENNSNYVQALETSQSVISDASSKQQKDQLYTQLATAEVNLDNFSQAITYYQTKHQIDPNTDSMDAQILGDLYQQNGQNQQAVVQYKLAIAYLKTKKPTTSKGYGGNEVQSLNAEIKYLESK